MGPQRLNRSEIQIPGLALKTVLTMRQKLSKKRGGWEYGEGRKKRDWLVL